MSYQHLTIFQRARIETIMNQGLSLNQVVKKLSREASMISRELKRNAISDTYYPEQIVRGELKSDNGFKTIYRWLYLGVYFAEPYEVW